jgi:hypothetical protein
MNSIAPNTAPTKTINHARRTAISAIPTIHGKSGARYRFIDMKPSSWNTRVARSAKNVAAV